MHELSLAEEILDIVIEQSRKDDFEKVSSIRLAIGSLSHVEPSALEFCFDAVVKGTIAEGAKLLIERVNGEAYCSSCHQRSEVKQLYDPCSFCGAFGLDIVKGQEFRISSIEVA